jgi:UDP-N-acetylmuramate: L-alanyl-gamma-D-glutamyl-meso-diaminopimelate ligase
MKNIHFIAIGGAVMHNLAIALHLKGYNITGSDDEIYEPAKSNLEKHNILPKKLGWFETNIHPNIDAVILGMHAKADNPELLKARHLGLKIYSFPEFMYEQAKNKTRIIVGGSHGKTTTTAMILHVLKFHQIKFDYLIGSKLEGFNTMVDYDNDSKIAVFEGDEYLTSALDKRPKFHVYQANIGIITGIAWDHMNVFPTYENYIQQFKIFAENIPQNGTLIYCAEDTEVVKVVNESNIVAKKIPYVTPLYKNINGKIVISHNQTNYPLCFFGKHNLQNMMAAMHACTSVGLTETAFYEALQSFKGTSKRLEVIHETKNSLVIRDFAHAPSKLKASISAVKELYPNRKLIAIYELHTYSSLNKDFLPQYHNSMQQATISAVLFSKHALTIKKMPMLLPKDIENGFGSGVNVFSDKNRLLAFIKQNYTGNENVLLMSSGNFDGMPLNEIYS